MGAVRTESVAGSRERARRCGCSGCISSGFFSSFFSFSLCSLIFLSSFASILLSSSRILSILFSPNFVKTPRIALTPWKAIGVTKLAMREVKSYPTTKETICPLPPFSACPFASLLFGTRSTLVCC